MAQPNYVPTVEEIRARLAGGPVPANRAVPQVARADRAAARTARNRAEVRGQIENVENQVEELRQFVTMRGRKTPQELREALDLIMDKYNMEPVEELVKLVMSTQDLEDGRRVFRLSDDQRIKVLLELAQYRVPKLRSTEVTGTMNHTHQISIVRYGDDGVVKREKLLNPVAPVTNGPGALDFDAGAVKVEVARG